MRKHRIVTMTAVALLLLSAVSCGREYRTDDRDNTGYPADIASFSEEERAKFDEDAIEFILSEVHDSKIDAEITLRLDFGDDEEVKALAEEKYALIQTKIDSLTETCKFYDDKLAEIRAMDPEEAAQLPTGGREEDVETLCKHFASELEEVKAQLDMDKLIERYKRELHLEKAEEVALASCEAHGLPRDRASVILERDGKAVLGDDGESVRIRVSDITPDAAVALAADPDIFAITPRQKIPNEFIDAAIM